MKKFNFWKENLKANHFELTAEEFKTKFQAWLFTKEVAWLEYYGTSGSITSFIADKAGLSSVYEQGEYPAIERMVGACVWDHVDRIKKLKPILQARFEEDETKFGFWKLPFSIAINEGHDLSQLTGEFLSQYKDNPGAMERILGQEAAELLRQMALPVYENI